jgi:hypothetical protein
MWKLSVGRLFFETLCTMPYAASPSDFVLPFFVKYDIFMLSVVSFPYLSTDVKFTP